MLRFSLFLLLCVCCWRLSSFVALLCHVAVSIETNTFITRRYLQKGDDDSTDGDLKDERLEALKKAQARLLVLVFALNTMR